MYIVFLTSLLAIILTYLESSNYLRRGMMLGFFLVTFLGCIHYDYGNDYMAYFNMYKDITKYPFDLKALLAGDVYKEPGWALICYLFKDIGGFFTMVAALNIIQNALVYNTIRNYVSRDWLPLAVFIYLFNPNLYLLNFSMMRQSFVICVFLGIWPLILRRKSILSVLILFICSTIHSSALILMPFAFWGWFSIKHTRIISLLILVFYLALFLGGNFLSSVFNAFLVVDKFNDYAEYYADSGAKVTFGFGFLINQIPFILSLFYYSKTEFTGQYTNNAYNSQKSIVLLGLFSYVMIPFVTLLPLIARIIMYFNSYLILSLPIVFENYKWKYYGNIVLFIFIIMMMYDYFIFFNSPVFSEKYTVFKTIFPLI